MYSKYTGIILKKHPLGEADELLTIFTKDVGKLRAKAISSRKIQSRLGGHLQSLNEVEFETAGRTTSGGGLPVIISVRAITINNYLRENLNKFAYALVGAETIYRLTPDRQENLEAYDALAEFLKKLGQTLEDNLELRRFQLRLLDVSGYRFYSPLLQFLPTGGGGKVGELTLELEREIDQFLQNIMEREIKSKNLLNFLI